MVALTTTIDRRLAMRFRYLSALTMLVMLFSLLFPVQRAAAAESPWSRLIGLPPGFAPTALAYETANRAWVVGSVASAARSGAIYRLELSNGIWYPTTRFDVPQPLNTIFVRGADDVWAAGDQAFVAHITNLQMQSSTISTNQGVTLTSFAFDGTTFWAVGYEQQPQDQYRGFVAHQNTTAWEELSLPAEAATAGLRHAIARDGALWLTSFTKVLRYAADSWTDLTPIYCENSTPCSQTVMDLVNDSAGPLLLLQRYGGCAICVPHSKVLQWDGTSWKDSFSIDLSVEQGGSLSALATAGDTAMAVGESTQHVNKIHRAGLVVERRGGVWSAVPLARSVILIQHVTLLDADHALMISNGSILTYGYPYQTGMPLDARSGVRDPHQNGVDYFPETGHTLRGEFRNRWHQYGGLAQFGYPLTEEVGEISRTDGQTYLVQYFERARFELHPDLPRPYNVLLGLLGRSMAAGREQEAPFVARPNPGTGYYTPETGHSIAPEFLRYWQSHGGLSIYGFPISEAFVERDYVGGPGYLVQYFERNRFELHPELPEPYRVSLGLLGVEELNRLHIQ